MNAGRRSKDQQLRNRKLERVQHRSARSKLQELRIRMQALRNRCRSSHDCAWRTIAAADPFWVDRNRSRSKDQLRNRKRVRHRWGRSKVRERHMSARNKRVLRSRKRARRHNSCHNLCYTICQTGRTRWR